MAEPTEVNGQITDAVTQTVVLSPGSAPASALMTQQQVWSHAMGLGFENAVSRQQAGQTLAEALLAAAMQPKAGGTS